MPVKTLIRPVPSAASLRLKEQLVDEWKNPNSTAAQPVIAIEDSAPHHLKHVYVIWDEWENLPQVDRSEIVMEAAEEVLGIQTASTITVAMGLTPVEADRMGIRY